MMVMIKGAMLTQLGLIQVTELNLIRGENHPEWIGGSATFHGSDWPAATFIILPQANTDEWPADSVR